MAGEFGLKRQFVRSQGLDSILGYVQIKATSCFGGYTTTERRSVGAVMT